MSKFQLMPRTHTHGDDKNAQPASGVADFVAGGPTAQSQSAGQRPPKPIRLNLDLDVARHRRLKMYAVENGLSVSELVRNLIDTIIPR